MDSLFLNEPVFFRISDGGLYIGDIEDEDADLCLVLSFVDDVAISLVDERLDIDSPFWCLLNVSEEGDDRFLVSELFKRFNGF
jgi:hypothetical protein